MNIQPFQRFIGKTVKIIIATAKSDVFSTAAFLVFSVGTDLSGRVSLRGLGANGRIGFFSVHFDEQVVIQRIDVVK